MNLFLNARTIFRYYNKLIQLFNRYSTPDQVIELAECALNSLKKETDPEYAQHHSQLHSILFACHLRLGNTKQAYKAMIDNSDQNLKQNCLRQFIVNLCEAGKYKELVSYPYIGLENDFVSILESKARSSSIRKTDLADESSRKQSKVSGVCYHLPAFDCRILGGTQCLRPVWFESARPTFLIRASLQTG